MVGDHLAPGGLVGADIGVCRADDGVILANRVVEAAAVFIDGCDHGGVPVRVLGDLVVEPGLSQSGRHARTGLVGASCHRVPRVRSRARGRGRGSKPGLGFQPVPQILAARRSGPGPGEVRNVRRPFADGHEGPSLSAVNLPTNYAKRVKLARLCIADQAVHDPVRTVTGSDGVKKTVL